jgi:hypothetical protein
VKCMHSGGYPLALPDDHGPRCGARGVVNVLEGRRFASAGMPRKDCWGL